MVSREESEQILRFPPNKTIERFFRGNTELNTVDDWWVGTIQFIDRLTKDSSLLWHVHFAEDGDESDYSFVEMNDKRRMREPE